MKIAFVIPAYIPAYSFGGPVSVLRDLVRILRIRGDEITIYTTNAINTKMFTSLLSQEYIEGILVKRYRVLFKIAGYWVTPLMFKDLMKDDIDIIHVHCARSFQLDIASFVSKLRDKPLIITAHGALSAYREMGFKIKFLHNLQNIILKFTLRHANKLTALSQIEVEQYKDMGVVDENIDIIPNGIDLSEYIDLPSKGEFKKNFNIPKDKKIILYVGRIHRGKGIDFLLKAFACLINNLNFKDVLLVVVGPDDGYLHEVQSLSGSLGISNSVLFTGFISNKDKISAYVDSSICIYLNPNEPFGIVSIEAAVSKLPVVVSEGTPMSEIVKRGGFGFSIKYGNILALVKTMETILKDEKLANEIGKCGREYVFENFGWDTIIDKYEMLYGDISARNG